MKISALNTAVYSYKQNKTNNNNNIQNSSLRYSYQTDSVSFKSLGYLKDGLDYVDNIIKTDIAPFMKDSKNLYLNAAKIGLNAQESLNAYKKLETDLLNYKMDLRFDTKNPIEQKVEKYLQSAKKYENNMLDYDRLSSISNLENYNTPEIKSELKEYRALVFAPDKDLQELKRFTSSYEDNLVSLASLLDNVTLRNTNPAVVKRLETAQKRFMGAIYYMNIAPYNEAMKLIKERNALEKDALNKPRDIYAITKRLDKLQQNAQSLSETINVYYEKKDNMAKFIEASKHYELLTPSPDDLKQLYSKMIMDCKELERSNTASFEKEYSQNFEQKLSGINLDRIDETLNIQNEKAKKIQSMIDDIKQEFINKNNAEFFKSHGLQDED